MAIDLGVAEPDVVARGGKTGLPLGAERTDSDTVRPATALGTSFSRDSSAAFDTRLALLGFEDVACNVLRRDSIKGIRFFFFPSLTAGGCGWIMDTLEVAGAVVRGFNDGAVAVGGATWEGEGPVKGEVESRVVGNGKDGS